VSGWLIYGAIIGIYEIIVKEYKGTYYRVFSCGENVVSEDFRGQEVEESVATDLETVSRAFLHTFFAVKKVWEL